MIPLLGVTWLFGVLLPLHKAFAYILTIFNSNQVSLKENVYLCTCKKNWRERILTQRDQCFFFNRVLWFSSCTAWETRRYNITFSFQAYSVSRLNQFYFLPIDRQFLFYHSSLDFFSCFFFSYLFLFLIVLGQFYCQLKMNPMINFTFLSP